MCPPIGTTPRYALDLHLDFEQVLESYAASSNGVALGCCFDSNGTYGILAGPIDTPLELAPGFDLDDTMVNVSSATIGGDGTAFLIVYSIASAMLEYRTYTEDSGGTWTRGLDFMPTAPAGGTTPTAVSGPTATTPRRFVYTSVVDQTVHDAVDDGTGGWTDGGIPWPMSVSMLQTIDAVRLSHDGLRLVLLGEQIATKQYAIYYTDRPSVDAQFRAPDELAGLPTVAGVPYITDDCARAYVVGLGRVFYQQQI